MLPLRELQAQFVDSLLKDAAPGAALASNIESGSLSATRRIGIYRNNLFASLAESLSATYPAVYALVGEKYFSALARHYIQAFPSSRGDLHAFGDRFATFVESLPHTRALPWLGDLARLEWAYHEVFHAAEASALAATELARFSANDHARLVLRLHPASALVTSRFPLTDIWRLGIHGDAEAANVDLDAGAQQLLVARRDLEMGFQQLSRSEFAFVEAMAGAGTLLDCAQAALGVDPDFDIQSALARQFALGNVTHVRLAPRVNDQS